MHLQSHCNVRLADDRLEKLAKKYNAVRFLAKLPRTPEGMLSSIGRTANPQAQDGACVPAGTKRSIADKLKALFGMSTSRPL